MEQCGAILDYEKAKQVPRGHQAKKLLKHQKLSNKAKNDCRQTLQGTQPEYDIETFSNGEISIVFFYSCLKSWDNFSNFQLVWKYLNFKTCINNNIGDYIVKRTRIQTIRIRRAVIFASFIYLVYFRSTSVKYTFIVMILNHPVQLH